MISQFGSRNFIVENLETDYVSDENCASSDDDDGGERGDDVNDQESETDFIDESDPDFVQQNGYKTSEMNHRM